MATNDLPEKNANGHDTPKNEKELTASLAASASPPKVFILDATALAAILQPAKRTFSLILFLTFSTILWLHDPGCTRSRDGIKEMAGIDDLNSNAFFQIFQKTTAFAKAPEKKFIVCVPLGASLPQHHNEMGSKDFIASHVLSATDQKDEYRTLDGRILTFRDQKLVCGSGFPPPPRTVSVVQQETYYNDDFESFEVLRISAPLIGKSSLDCSSFLSFVRVLNVIAAATHVHSFFYHFFFSFFHNIGDELCRQGA